MSRKYDTRTTEFSPEGRLYQLEYSMEAISKGGTGIGICTKDGVVFAAERRNTSKLIDYSSQAEKMLPVDNHIACLIAGLHADANTLIEYAQKSAQDYRYTYQEAIPVEQLVRRVANLKHSYTQQGGYRPFGVSLLYAGWDAHKGYQLFESDPSGNFGGWNAVAIGNNASSAREALKKRYSEDMDEETTLLLAIEALCKAMDSTDPDCEKMEFSVLRRSKQKSGEDADEKLEWTVLGEERKKQLVELAKTKVDFSKEED